MTKDDAILVKLRAKAAIAELDAIVMDAQGRCSEEEFEKIRRAVGNSMVVILDQLLEPIFKIYPEIDDLR